MSKKVVTAIWILSYISFIVLIEYLPNSDFQIAVWRTYMALFLAFWVFYFAKYTVRKKYVPKFDVIIALLFTVLSFILIFLFGVQSVEPYTGSSHLLGLASWLYSIIAATFTACLFALNTTIYFIKSYIKTFILKNMEQK